MSQGQVATRSSRWLIPFGGSLVALLATAAFGTSAASADTQIVGLAGWQVQSSAQATQPGKVISKPGFPTGSWLHVTPDAAGAVGTEVGALVQTGHCPDVFFSDNLKQCFGYMDTIGRDTIPSSPSLVVPHQLLAPSLAGVQKTPS